MRDYVAATYGRVDEDQSGASARDGNRASPRSASSSRARRQYQGQQEAAVSTVNPYAPPNAGPPLPEPELAARRDATWAIVLGAASLVLCAPITAPFALWKAFRALRVRPFARAAVAIVFAVLGLLASALFWFLAIWQFLSPGEPTSVR
jgi:hypothetical protein